MVGIRAAAKLQFIIEQLFSHRPPAQQLGLTTVTAAAEVSPVLVTLSSLNTIVFIWQPGIVDSLTPITTGALLDMLIGIPIIKPPAKANDCMP